MANGIQDDIQGIINALTPLWYGTSEFVAPGKALVCEGRPPFVVIHPDDVSHLPPGARHLSDYRPTATDVAEQAHQWLLDHPMPVELRPEDELQFRIRHRILL